MSFNEDKLILVKLYKQLKKKIRDRPTYNRRRGCRPRPTYVGPMAMFTVTCSFSVGVELGLPHLFGKEGFIWATCFYTPTLHPGLKH